MQLLPFIGKWNDLATAYPDIGSEVVEKESFVYIKIGWVRYSWTTTLESTVRGLRIKSNFLLKSYVNYYKTFLIPWGDLIHHPEDVFNWKDAFSISSFFKGKKFGEPDYIFTTAKRPNIKIRFYKNIGNWILEAKEKYSTM